MNRYHERLMKGTTIRRDTCVVCGRKANNNHHVVEKSQGGANGPTLTLCGSGTTGCHGKCKTRNLHFRWDPDAGGWWFLETEEPHKYEKTLDLCGWRRIPGQVRERANDG